MFKNFTTSFYLRIFLTILAYGTFGFQGLYAQVNGFPYSDSFKDSTSPNTVLSGNDNTVDDPNTKWRAFLTAGPGLDVSTGLLTLPNQDPEGNGYLRLTDATLRKNGYARNTTVFSSQHGLDISFEFYTYGGTGADGMTFFLFDAEVLSRSDVDGTALGYYAINAGANAAGFQPGAFGGSLGYAQRDQQLPYVPQATGGVSKGFIGIGFDELGNFANPTQGRQGGPGNLPSSVTLRGDGDGTGPDHRTPLIPGNGAGKNYMYLTSVQTTALASPFSITGADGRVGNNNTSAASTFRKARITMEPVGNPVTSYIVNVYVTTGGGTPTVHHVIQNYSYTPVGAIPVNLSYGFAASTGGSTNYHEIRTLDIVVPSSSPLPPTQYNTVTVTTNEDATYTFTLQDFTSKFLDPNGFETLDHVIFPTLPLAGQGVITLNGTPITNSTQVTADDITAGNLRFVPASNWHGTTTGIKWQGYDQGGLFAATPGDVTITVNSINDEPAGADKTINVATSATYTFAVADFPVTDANDTNPGPANTLDAVLVTTLPASGTLRYNGTPVDDGDIIPVADITAQLFTYEAPGTSGTQTFTFQVRDNGGTASGGVELDQSPNTITFNIAPPSVAPTSANGAHTALEDVVTTVPASVFTFADAGDTPAHNLASVRITTLPANGILFIDADDSGSMNNAEAALTLNATVSKAALDAGRLKYLSATNGNGNGHGTFGFTVIDDGGAPNNESIAYIMTVNVTAVNDAPSFTKGADQTVNEDAGPQTVNSWATAISAGPADESAQSLTFTVTANTNTALFAAGPAISASGTLTYTPAANANGTATISIRLSDNGLTANGGVDQSAVQTFTITVTPVNDPPQLVGDSKTTPEDTPVNGAVTGTDADGDAIAYSLDPTPANQPQHGTVVVNTDGTYTYTPTANYNGNDSFIVVGTDGNGGTANATVTITVTPVNDPPVAVNDATSTPEDTPVSVSALVNDSDVDGDAITITTATVPSTQGTVTITDTNTKLLYTPANNFTGTAVITYTISDGKGGTATATVTVTVTPVNDPPVAVNDTGTTTKATPLSVSPLANDTDVDGDVLTITSATVPGTQGTVTITDTNTKLLYTPASDFLGTAVITYSISDGKGGTSSATVTVTVIAPNNPPVAVNDTGTTPEDTPLSVSPLANDTDADGDALTISSATVPGTQGTVTITDSGTKLLYTPTTDFVGTATISYTISDGKGGTSTATVTITVTESRSVAINVTELCINDVPWVQYTVSGTGFTPAANSVRIQWKKMDGTIVSDLSNQPLTGQLLWPGAAVDGNGKPTAWPGWEFVNGQWVTKADGLRPAMKLHIIVNPENEVTVNYPPATPQCSANPNTLPVATADSYTVARGGVLNVTAPGVLTNDTDADQHPLTAVKVTDPANGTVTLNANGSFTYTNNGGIATSDSFTYYATDSRGNSNTATVTITISAANTPPVIADVPKQGTKDVPVTFVTTDFTSKYTDPSPLVKIRVISLPPTGSLAFNGTPVTVGQEIPEADIPKLVFTPAPGSTAPVSFQYNSSDGTDYANTPRNVNISLNSLPLAVADSYSVARGGTLAVTLTTAGVLANDSDSDGNPLTSIKVSDPSHGTLVLNSNGTFTYVNNGSAASADSFSYKVNDGLSDGNTVTVTITITGVNAPPVVAEVPKIGTGFAPITFTTDDFVSKYNDPNGDPLTKIRIVSLPPATSGVLKLNGVAVAAGQEIPVAVVGTLTFEPGVNFNGTVSFPWNGSDGTSYAVNPANVAITIALAGDPTAKIGLAKHLASVHPAPNGSYDVTFIFTAKNFGLNALENISIRDNLAIAFGGTTVTVKSLTAFGNLKANTAFTGLSVTDLLLPTSRLNAGEEAKVELVVNVKLGQNGGTFLNTATAEGTSTVNGFKVTDVSTNGLKPDPTSANDVTPSDSTPIQLDALPAYVPQGFSPNGDGKNDKFIIQNADGKHVSLEVYNRWGNRVYKSADYKNDWGGEVSEGFFIGRDIPDGTYYYIIIIDKKDKYTGFITINR